MRQAENTSLRLAALCVFWSAVGCGGDMGSTSAQYGTGANGKVLSGGDASSSAGGPGSDGSSTQDGAVSVGSAGAGTVGLSSSAGSDGGGVSTDGSAGDGGDAGVALDPCRACEMSKCKIAQPTTPAILLSPQHTDYAAFGVCYSNLPWTGDPTKCDVYDRTSTVSTMGPAPGTPKSQLCQAALQCARSSKSMCVSTSNQDFDVCYCGTVDVATCIAGQGMPNGDCKSVLEDAAETTDPMTIGELSGNNCGAYGAAQTIVVECDIPCCPTECHAPLLTNVSLCHQQTNQTDCRNAANQCSWNGTACLHLLEVKWCVPPGATGGAGSGGGGAGSGTGGGGSSADSGGGGVGGSVVPYDGSAGTSGGGGGTGVSGSAGTGGTAGTTTDASTEDAATADAAGTTNAAGATGAAGTTDPLGAAGAGTAGASGAGGETGAAGAGGAPMSPAFSSLADNFRFASNVDDWTATGVNVVETFGDDDAEGTGVTGSLQLAQTLGDTDLTTAVAAVQCVPATAGTTFDLDVSVKVPDQSTSAAYVEVVAYPSDACWGPVHGVYISPQVSAPTWQHVSLSAPLQSTGVQSISVQLVTVKRQGHASAAAMFDSVLVSEH